LKFQIGVARLDGGLKKGGTIPIMKKALFQAEEATLKRGDMSGSLALRTIRLNNSS
jgi:hypothetical protein